jgi:hypothetical protein
MSIQAASLSARGWGLASRPRQDPQPDDILSAWRPHHRRRRGSSSLRRRLDTRAGAYPGDSFVITVFVYINTSTQVGDLEHVKGARQSGCCGKWVEEND